MTVTDITVTIQSPQGRDEFSFAKTTKVGEVIDQARRHFGYEPGNFTLRCDATDEILAPERPLVSYHLEECELLLLVPETGSGV